MNPTLWISVAGCVLGSAALLLSSFTPWIVLSYLRRREADERERLKTRRRMGFCDCGAEDGELHKACCNSLKYARQPPAEYTTEFLDGFAKKSSDGIDGGSTTVPPGKKCETFIDATVWPPERRTSEPLF